MNGEAGGVYDPSDLTAEKVAWRRNLLTWSEDFTNAAWTKTDTTITANSIAAPDGTLTADLATEGTAGNARTGSATVTLPASTTVAASFFLKRGNTDWVRIFVSYAAFGSANGAGAWFNLATGQKGTTAALGDADQVSSVIADAGNGWYRCTLISRSISTANVLASVNSASADGSAVRVNNATFYPWGAQLEASSTATAYQRITDFTSDFLAAFPTHGLYQDAAGTTPVTALGQPVGLVIDSKTGGLANVGPELVTNGDFAVDANWTKTTGWTISGGTANASAATTTQNPGLSQSSVAVVAGTSVLWSFTVSNLTAGAFTFRIYGSGGSDVLATVSANGTYRGIATVRSDATGLIGFAHGAGLVCSIDNVSVKLVPGVHAIQPTNSSRPLLDGRVNLLTFSEQFDNAAWTKVGSATVTANSTVSPDGTTTADTVAGGAGLTSYIVQSLNVAAGAEIRVIAHVRQGTATSSRLRYFNSAVSVEHAGVIISWTAGVPSTNSTTGTWTVAPTYAALGSGWYRLEGQFNIGAQTSVAQLFYPNNANDTSTTIAWGFDVRLATDAAYPYQRIAAATDYADVGVPRAFAFDGFDDSLYTASNMDLSGTDKVTVLAGVRKLSDAADATVVELSASVLSNAGSFMVLAPEVTVGSFSMYSRGTAALAGNQRSVIAWNTQPAPTTRVLAGLANIAAPSTVLRSDGVAGNTATGTQGTGNYGSYVMFIGRRNNTSTPFNGKAYQLIVRGALTDAATLAQAERYVAKKTGVTI